MAVWRESARELLKSCKQVDTGVASDIAMKVETMADSEHQAFLQVKYLCDRKT